MSVAIVDYGSGNLHSAAKAFERAARETAPDQSIVVTSDPDTVRRADRIVLPGVGAFADCRRGLDAVPGMVDALEESVRRQGKPFFGICVGMQLMAERGREYVVTEGLGWIAGEVDKIAPVPTSLKDSPHGLEHARRDQAASAARRHRGRAAGPARLFRAFLSAQTDRARRPVGGNRYGGPITAVVGRDNMVGTQFHPEKSQRFGLALISNFLKWKP